MLTFIIRRLLVAIISVIPTIAFANLSLDRMIIYFDADRAPREDVVVTNPENQNLYLQTEVYEVKNPGRDNEELVRITDPNQVKLLATPDRAIIPPNGRKTIRLVSLQKPSDIEKVYRVTFKPAPPEFEATQSAIKLLIAYQALVFIQPKQPKYVVEAKSNNNTMTFTNTGNANVMLRDGQYCLNDNKESCTDLEDSTRLYAGQSWNLTLPSEKASNTGYVQFSLFDGRREKTEKFTL